MARHCHVPIMEQREIIAVLNSDPTITERIRAAGGKKKLALTFFDDAEAFIEFVNYELPEIAIYNFVDPGVKALPVLTEVRKDPWLHYGGIIGICNRDEEEEISEQLRDTNVIALISAGELEYYLERVIKIIRKHPQILFQRHLQKQFLSDLSGSFTIDNEPFDLSTYSHLITNYLLNAGYIEMESKKCLHIALMELLFNAVEHGNCAISYDEKSAWLGLHRDIIDLIHEKNKNPRVHAKKVHLRYHISPERTVLTIADQGRGFDWRARKAVKHNETNIDNLSLHGRGMAMATHFVRDLTYNEKGNEVTFTYPHLVSDEILFPRLFADHEKLYFEDGALIFKEDDESNYLYYIVSGKLDVWTQGKKLSTLTPGDVFVGEMSFLLSNRRSATVTSHGRSVLLRLPKKEFLSAMRTQPHYSIFLARLLAQRLARLNRIAGTMV